MSPWTGATLDAAREPATALEEGFPLVEVSELAEQESWRKEINRPIYHIHKWWAKRLGSVFRAIVLGSLSPPGTDIWKEFYRTQRLSGKVILDPFMGSGTTLGEALKLGAKVIGCDINPVSTFLVRQAFTRVPESDLRREYRKLERTVAPEIRRYYQTRDPDTGDAIPVLYYFWCKTVKAPGGEEVPLLPRYVFAQDAYPRRKPQARYVCPACWGIGECRYDATEATCAGCGHVFNPQAGPAQGQWVRARDGSRHRIKDLLPEEGPPSHRLYAILALRADGEKVYLPVGPDDLALYAEAEKRLASEDLPLPGLELRPGHNTNQARGYGYLHWRDFFNARQLLCLGSLLKAILRIREPAVQDQMLCLFSSTLEFNNLFCSFKGEGTGAVRHMFSNHILKPERTPLENSVWGTPKSSGTFSTLFESRLLPAKQYLDRPFDLEIGRDLFGERQPGGRKVVVSEPLRPALAVDWADFAVHDHAAMILNGDSSSLPVPDASVDAVITDPPYFDFVHYSELSDFFFAWLGPALSDRYPWMNRSDSSGQGEVQHKDPDMFANLLGRVLRECRRVLKDHGVVAFSFHHSRPDGWAAIHRAVADAGLAVVAAHPIHAELRAASPKSAARAPISLDAILVCRKDTAVGEGADDGAALAEADRLFRRLQGAGMRLSAGDRFVVRASQLLIPLSQRRPGHEEVIATFASVQAGSDA